MYEINVSLYETIEKKLIDDTNFSSEEKLVIIRALEKVMGYSNPNYPGEAKKFDEFWYGSPNKDNLNTGHNWDYSKGPTC